MKTIKDPRHQIRREAVKVLFAETFTKQGDYSELVKEILRRMNEIDRKIEESAPQWPIDKLNKIDLVILRLAVYELMQKNVPPKVVIDEAVELAKEFGAENSPSFVNGVLGTILNEAEKDEKAQI